MLQEAEVHAVQSATLLVLLKAGFYFLVLGEQDLGFCSGVRGCTLRLGRSVGRKLSFLWYGDTRHTRGLRMWQQFVLANSSLLTGA